MHFCYYEAKLHNLKFAKLVLGYLLLDITLPVLTMQCGTLQCPLG
jgi:hypothetical protein